MRRYDAIKGVVDYLRDEFVIACNGMISRELFTIKDRARNFYMLGSMGLASAIGLGIALSKPNKKVIVLAGDGNMLMSLGTLATIGKTSPKNFTYIVLDNECHESTGGQETASSVTKLDVIARSSGFVHSEYINSSSKLNETLTRLLNEDGPSFLHMKVGKERRDAPRVSIDPVEIKERFMRELAKG